MYIGRILCSCEIVPKELVNRQLSILLLQWNHRLNYEVEITTELTSLQFVDLLIKLNRRENQNATKERKRDTKKKIVKDNIIYIYIIRNHRLSFCCTFQNFNALAWTRNLYVNTCFPWYNIGYFSKQIWSVGNVHFTNSQVGRDK